MSILLATLLYLAATVFAAGILWKVFSYARLPSRNLLPIAPAPQTWGGIMLRMANEAIFFASLFRANKWTWLFGWVFHYALAVVLLRHLFFVTDSIQPWVLMLFPAGDIAAWLMIVSLAGLLGRRVFVDRVRYISTPSDYLLLLLIVLLGGTGLALRYVVPVDIMATRQFMLGVLNLSPVELPKSTLLYVHLASAIVLAVIFPFSKLIHFPGNFFSPSHNQKYSAGK